ENWVNRRPLCLSGGGCRLLGVADDLLQAEITSAGTGGLALVPVERVIERFGQWKHRLPAQRSVGLGPVQLEHLRFVRAFARVQLPLRPASPPCGEMTDDPLHGTGIGVLRAEVPR